MSGQVRSHHLAYPSLTLLAITTLLLGTSCTDGASPTLKQVPSSNQPITATVNSEPHPISWVDVANISDSEDPSFFSLVPQSAGQNEELQQACLNQLQLLIDQVAVSGDVGFLLIDLDANTGVSFNIDQPFYGASSVKGSFAAYVCERYLDEQYHDFSWLSPQASLERSLIENVILYSDNDDFFTLHSLHDANSYEAWCINHGIYDISYSSYNDFPSFSTRSLAQVWLNISDYLSFESPTSLWFGKLLSSTNRSEIRDGIVDLSPEAVVYNKAGWIADSNPAWNSVVDGAYIVDGDHRYLMAIMSSLPDGASSSQLISDIAASLYSCRELLH